MFSFSVIAPKHYRHHRFSGDCDAGGLGADRTSILPRLHAQKQKQKRAGWSLTNLHSQA